MKKSCSSFNENKYFPLLSCFMFSKYSSKYSCEHWGTLIFPVAPGPRIGGGGADVSSQQSGRAGAVLVAARTGAAHPAWSIQSHRHFQAYRVIIYRVIGQHGQEEDQHCADIRREEQTSDLHQAEIWSDEESLRAECSVRLWDRRHHLQLPQQGIFIIVWRPV